MKKSFKSLLILGLIGLLLGCKNAQNPGTPYVIMISIDGFRHDYVEKYNPPHLKALIKNGASAEYMLPSFPSKTFPNHYTLVTGLYPGNHGLVDNTFYDPKMDVTYSTSERQLVEAPAFYGGLPLWQLVQQHGMKSASYFWVGSEAPVAGSFPDYYHIYDGSVPNEDRVKASIDWLELPEADRPHFITLYFSLVDSQGHDTGPDSEETRKTVLEADQLIGLLMKGLETVDLPVNVIVTSDHGMNPVPEKEENLLAFERLLAVTDINQYTYNNSGTHMHLHVKDKTHVDGIYERLKQNEGRYKVYRKQDFPEKWHYQHHRVGDIFISALPGNYITDNYRKGQMLDRGAMQGQHGYDPYTTNTMRTIFYATGPNIKSGLRLAPFENVDVYPFVAYILGIHKLPEIDGDKAPLMPAYRNGH